MKINFQTNKEMTRIVFCSRPYIRHIAYNGEMEIQHNNIPYVIDKQLKIIKKNYAKKYRI